MRGVFGAAMALLAAGSVVVLATPGAQSSVPTVDSTTPAPMQDGFPHELHEGLFPLCVGCHGGAVTGRAEEMFPTPGSCGECHDGERAAPVDWTPPEPRVSNLRFSHLNHRTLEELIEGEASDCRACHAPHDPPLRMQVAEAPPEGCIACHAHTVDTHLAPEARCDICHVPLTQAQALSTERIAGFPLPESHEAPDFLSAHAPDGGLGQLQCATCHARETCEVCHVNANDLESVTALGRDQRVASLVRDREAQYPLPETHREPDWPWDHGGMASAEPARCANCHTQPSCLECHTGERIGPEEPEDRADSGGEATPPETDAVGQVAGRGFIHRSTSGGTIQSTRVALTDVPTPVLPRDTLPIPRRDPLEAIRTLPIPVPGGPQGVDLTGAGRRIHPADFSTRHASFAATGTLQCTTCHSEQYCADCHAGADSRAFHPDNFLERHAAEVFGASGECASCHSTEAFCRDCHVSSGIAADGSRDVAFHSAEPAWILTHGQAARVGLQSCASCHGQTDCLECHSNAGWGVNPHGPGFDAESMARQSPATCYFCHIGGPPGEG